MKNRKFLTVVLVCLLTITLFAACNGNGGNDGSGGNGDSGVAAGEIDVIELIARSAQVMQDVTEYDSTMEMDMTMEFEGEVITTFVVVDINAQLDPLRMKMTMIMDSPLHGMKMEIDTYAIHEGDYLLMYIHTEGMWVRQATPFSQELMDELMQVSTIEMMADLVTNAEIVGEEVIRGIDTWKIEVVMSAAAMMEILQDMPGGESFVDIFSAEMLAEMDDVASTLWIAKDGYYQIKVELDMTDAMAAMMADTGATLTKMSMIMTSFNFGNATPFELPPEAADAIGL